MSHLPPIPLQVVYAGLAGTVLALIVATICNRWSPRVFFLLTLRLAIGWHFLFEGLYKVQTYYTGPTETSKPFTSEPYFKVAPGPLGAKMRKEFSDPEAEIATKVKASEGISPANFAKLKAEEQAAKCPEAVAKQLNEMEAKAQEALKAEAEKELKGADDTEAKGIKDADDTAQRALKGEWTRDEILQIHQTADEVRKKARAEADRRRADILERQTCYEKLGPDLLKAVKTQPDSEMVAGALEAALKGLKAQADTDLKAISAAEKKALDDAALTEQKFLKAEWTDDDKAKIRTKAEADRKKAKEKADKDRQEAKKKADTVNDLVPQRILAAKAAYARWVYGVDRHDCKVKGITGDAALTAPQRLDHLEWVKRKAKEAEERETNGLGNGTGTDAKRVAEFRVDAITAESDLARDANSFIAELKKDLNGGKAADEAPAESRGQLLDRVTMWFLVSVGAFLMAGLFTRLSCLLAAGFLVMTYLAHPPFPWYPLPPNTEGNPVFINKNVIEALALFVLMCYPTGRWLGLDALVLRPFCKYRGERPV
jgi:uncharacterized membrane protein YphA (DoxX/SURF4 family)